jgi:hypothetical protein
MEGPIEITIAVSKDSYYCGDLEKTFTGFCPGNQKLLQIHCCWSCNITQSVLTQQDLQNRYFDNNIKIINSCF